MRVVITGANRGIGLAMAQQLHEQGHELIAVCREESEELEAIADQIISGIDITNDEAVAQLTQVIQLSLADGEKVDCLINNAGLLESESLDELNLDTIRAQFEINALAPLKLVEAVLPLMGEGGKIANITSRMGSIEDNTSGGYYGYRASKAALNAFGKSLAMDLKPKGIAVAQLHPGFVQTRMVGFNGDLTPEQAASGLLQRIEELTLENTGGFWHSNGQTLPW